MPMDGAKNSAVRYQGWNVFRSSSRDHMVPSVSPGRVLQRVRIQQAFPVAGVVEGVEALPLDVRASLSAAVAERRRGVPQGEDVPLGLMQYFPCNVANTVATGVNVNTDEEFRVIVVPFDGYIKEIIANRNASDAGGQMLAIRTSSGGTLFKSFWSTLAALPNVSNEPDFINFDQVGTGVYNIELRGGHIPVYAGDIITAVLRNTTAHLVGGARLFFTIGIEQVLLGSAASRVAVSAFGASGAQQAKAARDAALSAERLAIERERTARLKLEVEARLKLAELNRTTEKVKATLPPPPPPAPYAESAFTPESGQGKTFVSSWMPNENSIGYLIPTPPRGGKVNTFGDEYSVFDITGKLVDRGKVELVRSQDQIPPAARLSPNTRTTLSLDTRQSQADILATRRGESAFGQ